MRRILLFALLASCSAPRRQCDVEHLEVTWPATIQRGGVTTSEQLAASLTPTTIAPEVFDSLASTLVHGRTAPPAVLWSVPAFNTDPGGVAVVHSGRLAKGAVLRVAGVVEGGGWGVAATDSGPRVRIEAGDFVAESASGTISVLETRPVALRLDLTATDSVGDTIRVAGDARFSARRERTRCSSRGDP